MNTSSSVHVRLRGTSGIHLTVFALISCDIFLIDSMRFVNRVSKYDLRDSQSKRCRYRLRKTIYRMYQRVKCMIADMHQKVSKWLSNNYNEVLLPSFNTSDMTSKQKRISSKTSRAMLTWSHYKFKKLLECKMERSGGKVIDCREHYTTKTCSQCGKINHRIARQKVFTCSNCNLETDRDVNAARNIFLKNEHLLSWDLRFQVSEMPTSRLSS